MAYHRHAGERLTRDGSVGSGSSVGGDGSVSAWFSISALAGAVSPDADVVFPAGLHAVKSSKTTHKRHS